MPNAMEAIRQYGARRHAAPIALRRMSRSDRGDPSGIHDQVASIYPIDLSDMDAPYIRTQQGPAGRSGGSLTWAGLANTYFWVDPSKRVAGVILTQILPFADARVFNLYAAFESGVYKSLS